jgi:hypothetical protein
MMGLKTMAILNAEAAEAQSKIFIRESPDKGETVYQREFGTVGPKVKIGPCSAHAFEVSTTSLQKAYDDMVKASQTAKEGGRKFDGGKLQYGLVPPNALEATVEILTFGAEKYEPDNWKKVLDAKRRYFDAAQRHLWAWKSGEQNDQETGKNHLAHALCCLMFLYEHDTIDFLNNGEVNETIK